MEGNTDHSVDGSAPGTPLPLGEADRFLEQPRASFLDSNAGNSIQSTPNNSSPLLVAAKPESDGSEHQFQSAKAKSAARRRRPIILALIGLGILAIVVLAVILPVYFTVIKPKQDKDDATTSGASAGSGSVGSGSGNPTSPTGATSGGDGSEIILDDGTTFTYKNSFGGFWVYDPNDPFNNDARPNSWTPR
ncbi:hypothetical protein C8R42DRAFT_726250 [Lentinula raphanica]|nr:hypothetical protein C8R42DRAFT_726250 [Lentinula raphanica]